MGGGGPYPMGTWQLGGVPTPGTDIPATSVFLALYILGAIIHMAIFQKNRKRGHKFFFSLALFGFCMARTVTCVLRIANIAKNNNVPLSIAAAIFVAAGVVALYVVNLMFAQRIVRAQHPRWGWHPAFQVLCVSLYVLIVLTLIMLITTVVQSYYTLNRNTHRIDHDIQVYGATMYAVIATLPLPILALSLLLPRKNPKAVDKFGAGRFRTKILILATTSSLIASGAIWRAGTTWATPVPKDMSVPWYHQKVYFYIFDFTMEVLTVYLYAFLRMDLRFYVPNGARGPGSYRAGARAGRPADDTTAAATADTAGQQPHGGRGIGVYTEEETFDFDDRLESSDKENEKYDVESQPGQLPRTGSTNVSALEPLHRSDETLMGEHAK